MFSRSSFVFLLVATFLAGRNLCFGDSQQNGTQDCGFVENHTLIHRLAEGEPIFGVQPMGQEIYIIREAATYIEVFDRNTFLPKRNIPIANRGTYDMVQSSQSSSLVLSDWFNTENLTVVQINNGISSIWSLKEPGFNPTNFALAAPNKFTGSNMIVTASMNHKLKELSPDGKLIQEVILSDIWYPSHAIKVAADQYAVCDGYDNPPELHRVCLVNTSGDIIKCYGGYRGSGVGQLNVPIRLEVSSEGCILVADSRNKRVVLLNKDLEYIRDLIDSKRHMLHDPDLLYLDEDNDLLYVADNNWSEHERFFSGRVLVFKVK